MLRRLSLRGRLIIGVVGLAAIGLVTADIVTYSSLRSFLLDRTDHTLASDAHGFIHQFSGDRGGGRGPRAPGGPGDGAVFAQLRTQDGTRVLQSRSPRAFGDRSAPAPPDLPGAMDVPGQASEGPDRVTYFTVGAQSGGDRYRVRASIEPNVDGMLVVALSLHDVDATLDRLLLIETLVTALVLAAIALLGLWVVRLGLRPLQKIEETATAIADGGDLSRRIEQADERTEVGRLARVLNAMLGQIETAFRAREASERRLRRFVADASHELRTPLAAVRAYSELFGRGAASRPDDLARSMSGIKRETERMSLLVEDLVVLARLDEGRPFERTPLALDEVVSEAVETAQTLEPEREIETELTPATVSGDRDRLRQMVDNLLTNIREHTPAGAAARVQLRTVDGHVELAVSDRGPGMTSDDRDRVFERFYRADASRTRASGGTGLGLSIVAAVAEAHGGSASVCSTPGEGTTISIELPLAAAAQPPAC